ncbi:MAG: hypothetical protein N4A47_01210 [Clostridia bacterium]|jgi:uncharacterized membrane protein|nr:hypothetical protein [Clostridia bacterium]
MNFENLKDNEEIREQVNELVKDKSVIIKIALGLLVYTVAAILPMFIPVINIIWLIVGIPTLCMGFVKFLLQLTRDKETDIDTMFDHFVDKKGLSTATYWLYCVYLTLWMCVLYIPIFIKAFSYSMTFFLLADGEEETANNLITRSRKMMDGNKMKLFKLVLSYLLQIFLLVILLSAVNVAIYGFAITEGLSNAILLASVIGYYIFSAYIGFKMYLAIAYFYEDLKVNYKE